MPILAGNKKKKKKKEKIFKVFFLEIGGLVISYLIIHYSSFGVMD